MKPTKLLTSIIQQLALITLLTSAASVQAQNLTFTVDSSQMFNFTGIFASPGEAFQFQASGSVDISDSNGSYITDPNGTILFAPPSGSGAYNFFYYNADPLYAPPVVGSYKTIDPTLYGPYAPLGGAPYGALVAGFSSTQTPTSYSDFTGFTLIGALGSVTAPDSGGYLFLTVNDNHYTDNSGIFTVQEVPEPAALSLALVGAASFGWMRRGRYTA